MQGELHALQKHTADMLRHKQELAAALQVRCTGMHAAVPRQQGHDISCAAEGCGAAARRSCSGCPAWQRARSAAAPAGKIDIPDRTCSHIRAPGKQAGTLRAFCTWQSERMTSGCTLQSPAKQEQWHSAEARARAAEASSLCALAAELGSMQNLSRDQPSAESPSALAAPGSRRRASAEELSHCTPAMGHSSLAVDAGRDAVPTRCADTAAGLELSPEPAADVHEWPPRAPSAGEVDAQQSASIASDVMLATGCREPAAYDGPTAEGRQHAMPANTEEAAAVAHWGQSPSVIGRELRAPARPSQLTVEPSEDCASAGTEAAICVVLQNLASLQPGMSRICRAPCKRMSRCRRRHSYRRPLLILHSVCMPWAAQR